MKRIAILAGLLLTALSASGQISYPYVLAPTSDPTGQPCGQAPQLQVLYTTGAIYTCNNGTWAAQTSGTAYNPAAVAITGGTVNVSTVNGVVNAVAQTGADMGGKIVTACGVASVSGIIDARGFVGAQTWASADISTVCAGKTILLSKGQTITTSGTFGTVSAEILLGSGTTLDCGGAHLFMVGNAGSFERMIGTVPGAVNIEIKNCEGDGNNANNTNVAVQNHFVMLNNASNVSIHNNYWHNFNGDGVMLWGASGLPSSNVRVYDNHAAANQRTGGVSFINGQQAQVFDNWFDTSVAFEQVHAENDSSSGEFANDIVVDGNLLTSPPGVLSGISCSAQTGEGLNVSRWTITNNHLIGGRMTVQRCPYTTVRGNTIILSNIETPLNIASHHITVESNTITALDPSVTPDSSAVGINIDNSSVNDGSGEAAGIGFNVIADNTLDGVPNKGIRINNSSYNQLHNNTVRNIVQVSGNSYAVIQQQSISSLTLGNQISGNTITDTQVSPTTKYGIYWDGNGIAPNVGLNYISNMVTASTFGALLTQTTTVNGQVCALGGSCTVPVNGTASIAAGDLLCAAAADTTIQTVTITSGTCTGSSCTLNSANNNSLYQAAGAIIGIKGSTFTGLNGGPYTLTGSTQTSATFASAIGAGSPSDGTMYLWCQNQVTDAISPATKFANNSFTFPASSFQAGIPTTKTATFHFWSTSTAPTLSVNAYLGGTSVYGVSAALTMAASAANRGGSWSWNLLPLVVGTGGWIDTQAQAVIIPTTAAINNFANSIGSIPLPFNTTNSLQFQIGILFAATGVASGTYTSGITTVGTVGQTCTLTSFNNSSTATATVALTGTNTIAGGTSLVITSRGQAATAAPTSATSGTGTATSCIGTATIATVLGGASGNAVALSSMQ